MDVDITILTRWAGELESLAESTGLGGLFRTADDDDLPSCLRSAAAELAALRERVAVLERVRVAAENLDPADGSEDLSEALAAAKPAAQEGKEAADG